MVSLPESTVYGRVTGQIVLALDDTPNDLDDLPDPAPAVGTITFVPSVNRVFFGDVNKIVVPKSITRTLDNTGAFDVMLVANDSPGSNPTGWTWNVTVALQGEPPWVSNLLVEGGSNTDISDHPEFLVPSPGVIVTKGDPGPAGASIIGGRDNGDGTISFLLSNDTETDPVVIPPGPRGPSAYEIAVSLGFEGDEEDWVNSLRGEPGEDSQVAGPAGPSAYEIAMAHGFNGSEADWLTSLKGEPGDDSEVPGPSGDNAYEVAVANGFVGTEAEWLESLKGEPGITLIPDILDEGDTPSTPGIYIIRPS